MILSPRSTDSIVESDKILSAAVLADRVRNDSPRPVPSLGSSVPLASSSHDSAIRDKPHPLPDRTKLHWRGIMPCLAVHKEENLHRVIAETAPVSCPAGLPCPRDFDTKILPISGRIYNASSDPPVCHQYGPSSSPQQGVPDTLGIGRGTRSMIAHLPPLGIGRWRQCYGGQSSAAEVARPAASSEEALRAMMRHGNRIVSSCLGVEGGGGRKEKRKRKKERRSLVESVMPSTGRVHVVEGRRSNLVEHGEGRLQPRPRLSEPCLPSSPQPFLTSGWCLVLLVLTALS